jgi:hypothetical protein
MPGLCLTGRRLGALCAVLLVAYAYVWTPMTHHLEYTSDFFDNPLHCAHGLVYCAKNGRFFAIVRRVSALNRESAAFGA